MVAGVFVNPTSATVAPGAQQTFTASQPVVWTIQEGAAGGTLVVNSDGSATIPLRQAREPSTSLPPARPISPKPQWRR